MTYRKPVHRDANQPAIVAALKRAGCSIVDLAEVGGGCPDLLVGRQGWTYLIEVKNPDSKYRRALKYEEMTDDQIAFLAAWKGSKVSVVHTVEEALEVVCATADEIRAAMGEPK